MAVPACDGLHDLARPEDVVGDEHRAAADQRPAVPVAQQHAVVVGVLAFVAVDEHQVEHAAQRRGDVERRADMQPDFLSVGAAVEVGLRQLLQFVVHLHGVQFGSFLQSCGHREGRVPRERADFEHPLRPRHPYEHLQQPALDVSREHPRRHGPQIRLAVQFVQQRLLGGRQVVNVTFERVHPMPCRAPPC